VTAASVAGTMAGVGRSKITDLAIGKIAAGYDTRKLSASLDLRIGKIAAGYDARKVSAGLDLRVGKIAAAAAGVTAASVAGTMAGVGRSKITDLAIGKIAGFDAFLAQLRDAEETLAEREALFSLSAPAAPRVSAEAIAWAVFILTVLLLIQLYIAEANRIGASLLEQSRANLLLDVAGIGGISWSAKKGVAAIARRRLDQQDK
jgi:hypothetical protein